MNQGILKIQSWIKLWTCVFFHEKETKEFRVPDDLFTFNMGKYRGCTKCDIWRKL